MPPRMRHSAARPLFDNTQDLPHLTAVARVKIIRESRKSDHDLRHWVGHANFLDHLTRPSTIAANQQKIFAGFSSTALQKSTQPDVAIVEVDGDVSWDQQSPPKPKRPPPSTPKVSVVHCEVIGDDDSDEEDDLAMISRTISRHGQVRVLAR